jgi:hypothetical protein
MSNFEIIIKINNIEFFKGNIINNGVKKEQLIFTKDENFRVDMDEDLIKACDRIYHNYYE